MLPSRGDNSDSLGLSLFPAQSDPELCAEEMKCTKEADTGLGPTPALPAPPKPLSPCACLPHEV